MSCNLNGLYICSNNSVPGIKKLFLAEFGQLYNYVYDSDYLSKITNFSALSLPLEYKVDSGVYSESLSRQPARLYRQSLSADLSKMSHEKREELEKLASKKLTILFEDKNGKCWIFGTELAAKIVKMSSTSGGDSNMYSLEIEGFSRHMIQEVSCFNSPCFASFNGLIQTTSKFTIDEASLYDFSGIWQIQSTSTSGSNLLDSSPSSPLDPLNWIYPIVLAEDSQKILDLISDSSASVTLDYDSGSDIASITIISTTFVYSSLSFNGQSPVNEEYSTNLNLSFVLGNGLGNSVITVTDSNDIVLYSGNPFDIISDYGLSGIVSNANIDVSLLYPDGTIFTASIDSEECETQEYTYIHINPFNCDVQIEVAYNYGLTYSVEIPKNTTFNLRYQQTIIHYDEWQFNIISNHSESTDDFSTFEALVIAGLSSDPSCPIIASSISVVENLTSVTISFESSRRNSTLYVLYKASEGSQEYGYIEYAAGTQTNLMNISSLVPSNSYLSIINSTSTDELSGSFGNAPDVNEGFLVEAFDDSGDPIVIEDIAFDINNYIEDEGWTLKVSSPSCPETFNEIDTAVCYDDRVLSINRRYDKFTCDVSGNPDSSLYGSFLFSYDIGATTYNVVVNSANILGNSGTDSLSSAVLGSFPLHLGENPVKVLNFRYNHFLCTFTLELDCHFDVNWNYIEGDRDGIAQAFVLAESYDITNCEFDPIINPHTIVDWNFTDVDATIISENAEALTPFTRWRDSALVDIAHFHYDSGLNDMSVSLDLGTNQNIVRFSFWDSSFNLLEQINCVAPATINNQTLVSDPNDIAYVSISNTIGGFWWCNWNASTESDIDVFIPYNALDRNLWGRMDRWSCLTPAIFVPVPTITSILCP